MASCQRYVPVCVTWAAPVFATLHETESQRPGAGVFALESRHVTAFRRGLGAKVTNTNTAIKAALVMTIAHPA